MNILIAVASRHGASGEMANAISEELSALGLSTIVKDAKQAKDLNIYDAYIIGSAVYMGNWLRAARDLVKRNTAAFAGKPVWLFSSGPLGEEDPQPKDEPAHLDELMKETGAREHRVFVGKLDKQALGVGERLAVNVVKAPEGDFRDWESIQSWAEDIASQLKSTAGSTV